MTQNPIEQLKYRIMEVEMMVHLMHCLPSDGRWLEHYIPILEERVALLKQSYNRLWDVPE